MSMTKFFTIITLIFSFAVNWTPAIAGTSFKAEQTCRIQDVPQGFNGFCSAIGSREVVGSGGNLTGGRPCGDLLTPGGIGYLDVGDCGGPVKNGSPAAE